MFKLKIICFFYISGELSHNTGNNSPIYFLRLDLLVIAEGIAIQMSPTTNLLVIKNRRVFSVLNLLGIFLYIKMVQIIAIRDVKMPGAPADV